VIKAIIFDCFGVLTTDTWRAFLDSLPAEADIARARELNHQYDAGLITLEQFLEQVHEATGKSPQLVERMLDNEITKNTPLLDYIKDLKQTYKIGLLSNIATNWIKDNFLNIEEQALFDTMVFSYEVGMTKPDPRIFELACERLGVEPSEAVMIDDVEWYCQSAQSLGMKAIVYKDFNQLKQDLQAVLDHV
jgi:epoxide hydrolase-like predicted phosphatase